MFGHSRNIETDIEGLTITCKREDRPEFPRIYSVQITPEVHLEIDTKDYGFGGRYLSGELRQRSGSAVYFDPKDPADKILDRDLIPHVEEWCRRILQLDKDTFRTPPNDFVDETGQRWQRV